VLTEVRIYPEPQFTDSFYYGSKVEVSTDGTNWFTIITIGENFHGGWNNYQVGEQINGAGYRYIRFNLLNTTKSPGISEFVLFGYTDYIKDNTDLKSGTECPLTITINKQTQIIEKFARYTADATPVITQVTPTIGPTAGNTPVELAGFGGKINN
jgi:hypothetical protein